MITKETFTFLKDLKRNNNREWFEANRNRYQQAKTEFSGFTTLLISGLHHLDPSIGTPEAKDCIFRINRDVRFSHDKSPYKTNMGTYIARGGKKSVFAGYYFHLEPGGCFAAGGVYVPQSDALKAIRLAVWEEKEKFLEIIRSREFQKHFSGIEGEQLKTAPQSYPKDHPDVWLVRYKSYSLMKSIPDTDLFKPGLMEELMDTYRAMLPFNKFLNSVLEDL